MSHRPTTSDSNRRGNRRLHATLPMAMIALIATLAACSSNQGDAVAIIGDSITSLDEPALNADLGEKYNLTITGQFGFTIEKVIPAAELVSEAPQDQVIINLGSNDVIGKLDIATSIATLRSMVDLFPDARCVHLVNINEHMVDLRSGEVLTDQAQKFNAALDELIRADDQLSLIDWRTPTAETLSSASPPVSTLTRDSIHPTTEGNTKLNSLYKSALRAC